MKTLKNHRCGCAVAGVAVVVCSAIPATASDFGLRIADCGLIAAAPPGTGDWLDVVNFLLGIAVAISTIWAVIATRRVKALQEAKVTIGEQPVDVRTHAAEEFATVPALAKVAADVHELSLEVRHMEQRVLNRIDSTQATLNKDRQTSIAGLHSQLKAAEIKLGEVSATTISHTAQLDRIDEKVTLLLRRK